LSRRWSEPAETPKVVDAIILVDDGATDRTAELGARLGC
jgi:hypothetical protein